MCLEAESVSAFAEMAAGHRKLMDDFKMGKAQELNAMIGAARLPLAEKSWRLADQAALSETVETPACRAQFAQQ